jgi:hypothetical protein
MPETLSTLPSIFVTCQPRQDVKSGATKDEQYAADLTQVLSGRAPSIYCDPARFFELTYPTRGLKELLRAVCMRLSGQGGEVASIIRLGTQYGGGKTHSLIALVHTVHGLKGVANPGDFLDPSLLPSQSVRIAALDGENSDPANGISPPDDPDLRIRSLWGEMAYRLAGRLGYERIRVSDETHTAPGTDAIRDLFGKQPTLILIDEISTYLRKVERVFPGASNQFTAFVHALIKAVTSSPNVALVYTLAVGADSTGRDAYREENERAAAALSEAESVFSRSSSNLNPTEEDETAAVLRSRLFEHVDPEAARSVLASYRRLWEANRDALPIDAMSPELADQFLSSYPLHPKLLEMFKEKTSSLVNFQRTRGMLRLLARTVHHLWQNQPEETYAIHIHHLDPANERIRSEILTKLQLGDYGAAMKSDVSAVAGDEPALAQQLDQQKLPGLPPLHTFIARTVLWHSFAYGESARGIGVEQLKLAVCSPSPTLEPPFIEQARLAFLQDSIYLDDRPGAPLRFMAEANLNQIIRRRMQEIDAIKVREALYKRIKDLFDLPNGEFHARIFPPNAYDVPDDSGDHRPLLVVMNYETVAVSPDLTAPPPAIDHIFQYRNDEGKLRELKNNLVFVAADQRGADDMRSRMRRFLALEELKDEKYQRDLADYQKKKVRGDHEEMRLAVAMAILQAYRHLFYPSANPMPGASQPLGHTLIELSGAGENPGNGQAQVERVLREQRKLLSARDTPDSPQFVRDQTPLRILGEVTTALLRNEYRKAPKLSILLHDGPLMQCIRSGIEQGIFVYREGNQVWGKGDVSPAIYFNDNSFVHTMEDARKKKLWPRVEPLDVRFASQPAQIRTGSFAELTIQITGGLPPYTVLCSEPTLSASETEELTIRGKVSPPASLTYQVEVMDSRGNKQKASVDVMVSAAPGEVPTPPLPPRSVVPAPPPAPSALTAKGPLVTALSDLWGQARQAKYTGLSKLTISLTEAIAAWKLHQSSASLPNVAVRCEFEAAIGWGESELKIEFGGAIDKANGVKSFLDPNIRAADEVDFTARYIYTFSPALSLAGDGPETLAKNLTRAGGGEAYIQAEAIQTGSAPKAN